MTLATTSGGAWRIAPSGTREVYVVRRINDQQALVCSRVGNGWADKPMRIAMADLFGTRDEALIEYRRRRAAALKANPSASLNLTSDDHGRVLP